MRNNSSIINNLAEGDNNINLRQIIDLINDFKCVTDDDIEIILWYLTTTTLNFELIKKCCEIISIFVYLDIDI